MMRILVAGNGASEQALDITSGHWICERSHQFRYLCFCGLIVAVTCMLPYFCCCSVLHCISTSYCCQ